MIETAYQTLNGLAWLYNLGVFIQYFIESIFINSNA